MKRPSLHHVQILCPAGGEAEAEHFYSTCLSLQRIKKPSELTADGVWFALAHGAQLHIGVHRDGDEPVRNRQHFALCIDDLNAVCEHLRRHGVAWQEAKPVPGWKRVQVRDPFGNMVELLEIVDTKESCST